jgi:hypothetical protein
MTTFRSIRLFMALIMMIAAFMAATRPARAAEPLEISKFTFDPSVRLAEVNVTYHITPKNRSADVGIQIYARREDITDHAQWDRLDPVTENGMPLVISLYKGIDNTGTLKFHLARGVYGPCRVILFDAPDGKTVDYGAKIYDNSESDHRHITLGVTVKSDTVPTDVPHLIVSQGVEVTPADNGKWTVVIPVEVRYPMTYEVHGKGFWVMAKGATGFAQSWAAENRATTGSDPLDQYRSILVNLTLKNVPSGLWTAEIGLFRQSFGDPLQWLWPGVDFETGNGDWVKLAPAESRPPRLRVKDGRFVAVDDGKPYDFYPDMPGARQAAHFVRGGNFGNAICWKLKPVLCKPGYFVLLQEMGCRFIRVNFNADRYPQPLYQHAVDQVVQDILTAGLYPILAPQDLPKADSRDERVELGLRVIKLMANKYLGQPVWLEVLNEPQEFTTWAEWKPVATDYARAIRAVDPDAFVIVPFEGFSKDSHGAAADPLPAGLADLYDGHAYVKPDQVAAQFGPAIKAGLPVLIGEYGGAADYLQQMTAALQKLTPAPMAAAAWAFTLKDQDALPLIADGSTAVLKYTPAGQVIADAYAAWDKGKKVGSTY